MRARNIKPGILKNEILGTADPLLTILFEGLWMLADREGRLEDRPLRIKAEVFPYRESLDIYRYLTELASLGFIHRYSVNGKDYIEVDNFRKHQTPHKTEKPSDIPPKPLENKTTSSDTVNAQIITEPLPPDSLIPDSLIQVAADANAHAQDFNSRIQKIINSPIPLRIAERIEFWKSNGASEQLIEEAISRVMAKRKQSPPNAINYFDGAIADAIAQSTKPLPNPQEKSYAPRTSKTAAAANAVRAELGIPIR